MAVVLRLIFYQKKISSFHCWFTSEHNVTFFTQTDTNKHLKINALYEVSSISTIPASKSNIALFRKKFTRYFGQKSVPTNSPILPVHRNKIVERVHKTCVQFKDHSRLHILPQLPPFVRKGCYLTAFNVVGNRVYDSFVSVGIQKKHNTDKQILTPILPLVDMSTNSNIPIVIEKPKKD